jgi:ribosome-associated protein
MPGSDGILVSAVLTIPRDELLFRASRSGGPGGQHVNTSSTRIELVWDVGASPSLSDHQRVYLLRRLATRLDSQGKLRIVSQDERSQLRNREAAITRFVDIVAKALVVPKQRRRTKPPRSSKRARLETKRKRGAIKRERQRPSEE